MLEQLETRASGLTHKQAAERLDQLGPNVLHRTKHEPTILTFIRQFKNLLVIMLLVSAALSIYLGDNISSGVGIFRMGHTKKVPSYYIGHYLDMAGFLKE